MFTGGSVDISLLIVGALFVAFVILIIWINKHQSK
jgi:LPXTG-motif cell wall-anchored protein